MSTEPRGKKRKERGSILLLAFFFLIVLFALAVAFFRIIPAEYHSAAQARRGVQAHFAGDAGIRKGVAWLTAQPSHFISNADIEAFNAANFVDGETLPKDNAILVANRVDDNWSFTSRINLDESDFFRRIYVIETFAYFNGRRTRMTKSTVQNESFAKYALLYDIWNEGLFFGLTPNGIQGPMHTNGFPRLSTANDGYFDGTSDAWISGPLASLTHSASYSAGADDRGDGVQYQLGNVTIEGDPTTTGNAARLPYNQASGAPISSRYDKIIEGGREKIRQIQNIELPEENTDLRAKAWGNTVPDAAGMAALRAAKGPLLVNTTSGTPNDPGGVVSGGIFISGSDASEVRLDITPEGHQKTTVRQGDTVLPGTPSVQYFADVPVYRRLYQPPDQPWQTTECVRTETRTVDVWGNVRRTRTRGPEANASRCGTRLDYITGEGGLTTSITVPKICSWEEEYDSWEVVGTRDEEVCVESQVTASGVTTPPAYFVDCPPDHPDAEGTPYRTDNRNVTSDYLADPDAYPDAVEVETPTTRAIPNWNSVVEVNDDVYRIPFHAGMKINGDVIPNDSDPRLTVTDGNTVTIRNDYQDGSGNYREYTVMEGRINGITFSDVNLYGVRGTNKGSKYADELGNIKYQGRVIATNLATEKNLEIRDGILQYYDGPDADLNDGRNRLKTGETSPNADHILGIIANKVDIKPTDRSNRYENSDNLTGNARENYFNGGHFRGGINVFAVIMAGKDGGIGGFGAHNNAMDSNDGLGDFNLFGGIISSVARRTQRGHSGGFTTGFRLGLNYDPIAAEFLENFPTTNVYSVLRYVSISTDSTMTEGFSGGVKAF